MFTAKDVVEGSGSIWSSESKYWSYIRGVLRKGSARYPVKNNFIKDNRFKVDMGFFKNGKPKVVWGGKCNCCGLNFKLSELQVDHIIPAGSLNGPEDLEAFVTKLFCSYENFQLLCKGCHDIKSYADKYSISHEDALRGIKVASLKKLTTIELKQHILHHGGNNEDIKNPKSREVWLHRKYKITWLK